VSKRPNSSGFRGTQKQLMTTPAAPPRSFSLHLNAQSAVQDLIAVHIIIIIIVIVIIIIIVL
jgi:hypothetical protein